MEIKANLSKGIKPIPFKYEWDKLPGQKLLEERIKQYGIPGKKYKTGEPKKDMTHLMETAFEVTDDHEQFLYDFESFDV